jgi:pyrroloquinoline quinone biosynthesis protein D
MRSKKQSGTSRSVVRLAQGVRIDGDERQKDAFVLVCPDGKVHLNRIAAAILRLCDGSHDRDGLVAEVVRSSSPQARAAEIIEFLDAARARGWIDEA